MMGKKKSAMKRGGKVMKGKKKAVKKTQNYKNPLLCKTLQTLLVMNKLATEVLRFLWT